MTILEAAQSLSIYDAALAYAEAGVSVIPLTGKKAGAWADAQRRGASHAQIQYWNSTGQLKNVGVVCGAVSGNLVVIDCDGIGAVKMFADRFPELRQTLVVVTGSRKGAHFYFYSAFLPSTIRITGLDMGGGALGNIELRADGHYVVAPPSRHPDTGKLYGVGRALPVKRVASLEYVAEWLHSIRPKMSAPAAPKPSGGSRHTSDPVAMVDRDGKKIGNPKGYARVALNGECDKVQRAGAGNRNNQLNESACKMGGFIADGWIERQVVEAALYGAAAAAGLVKEDGGGQTINTIKSGIDAGMESSRVRYKNA